MFKSNSTHFTDVSILNNETEKIMQDLALKLSTDCSAFSVH